MYSSTTKTNYHRKSKWPKRIALGIAVVIAAVWGRHVVSVIGPLGNGIVFVGQNIHARVSGISEYFASKQKLDEEVRVLREEVARLQNERSWYAALETQNTAILKDIHRNDVASTSLMRMSIGTIASVMVRPPYSPFDIISVDAGSVQGIEVGDTAAWQGYMLGSVVEVFETTSKVRLLSSPDSTFTVRIRDIDAQAYGLGGGRYKVELPKGSRIAEGDTVTMPTMQLDVVGTIDTIDPDQSGAFVQAYFTLPIPFSELQYVDIH